MSTALKPKAAFCKANNTLTSGITITTNPQRIIQKFQHYTYDNILYKLVIETAVLRKATTNASLGWGEALFTFPAGVIKPLGVSMKTVSTSTGGAATAGEYGLGTVIASGANATIGAVGATSENIMEGTMISNHVDGTALTMKLHNHPVAAFDHGAGSIASGVNVGAGVIDATAGTTKCFLNGASAFAATGTIDLKAYVVLHYMFLGADFGVE